MNARCPICHRKIGLDWYGQLRAHVRVPGFACKGSGFKPVLISSVCDGLDGKPCRQLPVDSVLIRSIDEQARWRFHRIWLCAKCLAEYKRERNTQ